MAERSALRLVVYGLIACHNYCQGLIPGLATGQYVRMVDSHAPIDGGFLRALRVRPPIKLSAKI